MSGSEHQTLRMLEGRYVLERLRPGESPLDGDVLAVVNGPDGGARMRRDDSAGGAGIDPWVAMWNGDAAHPPDATGMLAAIVAPLAGGRVPVWVAASFGGDMVLVPANRGEEAAELLRQAGHRMIG